MVDEILEYHRGRKSLDHDYIFSVWDNDLREILQQLIADNPEAQSINWPDDKHPIMGFVRSEDSA